MKNVPETPLADRVARIERSPASVEPGSKVSATTGRRVGIASKSLPRKRAGSPVGAAGVVRLGAAVGGGVDDGVGELGAVVEAVALGAAGEPGGQVDLRAQP